MTTATTRSHERPEYHITKINDWMNDPYFFVSWRRYIDERMATRLCDLSGDRVTLSSLFSNKCWKLVLEFVAKIDLKTSRPTPAKRIRKASQLIVRHSNRLKNTPYQSPEVAESNRCLPEALPKRRRPEVLRRQDMLITPINFISRWRILII